MCKKIKQTLLSLLTLSLFTIPTVEAIAQARSSTQGHDGKVNTIVTAETTSNKDSSFYSTDGNGFIVKWSADGMGDHYQISNYKIELLAKNPNSGNIAIYETDGYSKYRVSVIDWRSFSRKYTKYFQTPVTAINFSEKGSYLLVGTADVGSTYIYDANTGRLRKQLSDAPGMVSLIKSSPTEKNLMLYSSAGNIVYYETSTYKVKQKVNAEKNLKQTILFGTGNRINCFVAGVKDNFIYILNSMNGKTIGRFSATKPFICTSKDPKEEGLYFISSSGKKMNLQLIDNTMLDTMISTKTNKIDNPIPPRQINSFSALTGGEVFTSVQKNREKIIIGTTKGNIYSLSPSEEIEFDSLTPITENMYEKIYDISSGTQNFYMLTNNGLFKSSFEKKQIAKISVNPGYTNIEKFGEKVLFWSKNSSKSVQVIDLENTDAGISTIFTPNGNLNSLHIYNDKVVTVQGHSNVLVYDINSGSNIYSYTGTSIEDAILVNETDLYIAKTKISVTDSPLMYINLITKETVSIDIDAQVAYSLSYNPDRSTNDFYGVLITYKGSESVTSIFDYNLSSKSMKTVFSTSDENSDVFTYLHNDIIYSNIGNSQLYSINLSSKRTTLYRRSASIPAKIQATQDRLAVLNRDGSISWYNTNMQSVLSDWYMAVDGSWYEF